MNNLNENIDEFDNSYSSSRNESINVAEVGLILNDIQELSQDSDDYEAFQDTANYVESQSYGQENIITASNEEIIEQNTILTNQLVNMRFVIDNTAPEVSAEYLQNNQVLVTVNELSYIEIRNIKDEVIGSGYIQEAGSVIIEIFDSSLKNGGQIFIYAMDYYVNTSIKELYVSRYKPSYFNR